MKQLITAKPRKNKKEKLFIIPILIVLIISMVIISSAVGAVRIPLDQSAKVILNKVCRLNLKIDKDIYESIIINIRIPRIIIAGIVGAALALCGTAMQSMFKNPMADPGVIGISSGASTGAVIAVALNLTAASMYYMPLLAGVGAVAAAFTIYNIAKYKGKVPILTLILSGIAVSTFLGAVNSLILSRIAEHKVREYLFWSVGSLAGRRWEHVQLALLPILLLSTILILFSKRLNILMLGEEEAHSMGVNPNKTRSMVLAISSLTTAIAVCVSGNIGFVGLVVPHIMRLLIGPDNRILMPVSALGGACFLIACDFIARTVTMPAEIGVGIVTAMVGAPYFIFLLMKARKDGISI